MALTVAAGVVLGLNAWVAEQSGWPTPGVNDALAAPLLIVALASLVLVPLIVGRWWVVGALAGPGLALLIMQLTGVAVQLDDGTGPAFNYRTVILLTVTGISALDPPLPRRGFGGWEVVVVAAGRVSRGTRAGSWLSSTSTPEAAAISAAVARRRTASQPIAGR